MKKPKLITLLTLCCVMLLSFAIVDFGTADDRMFSVTQNVSVTLYKNGIPVATLNQEGIPEAPILYGGTTYVSSYGIRQLFDVMVDWDKQDSIVLSSSEGFVTKPLVDLNILDDEVAEVRKPCSELNYSKQIKVTAVKVVHLSYGESSMVCTADCLSANGDIYIPIRDVGTLLGWRVVWNTRNFGVDIMAPDFAKSLDEFLTFDSDEVCISREYARGMRAWIYANIIQDSPTTVKFTGVVRRANKKETFYLRSSASDIKKQSESAIESRQQIAEIVDSLKLAGLSIPEKITKINSYICDRFKYDNSIGKENALIAPRQLTDILSEEKQVCEGYARLFTEMCKVVGIPTQYLLGYVDIGDGPICHAWCRVYVDGAWLYCDPTMCDGSKSKDVGLLLSEQEMIRLHKEYSMAIRY